MNNIYDLVIIGGGPAGLASAISARENNLNTLLIERESRLGGILKQCIHDGFGLLRYGEKLSGPEYAYRDIKRVNDLNTEVLLNTFVLDAKKENDMFVLFLSTRDGIREVKSKALILATGCRERTQKQVFIHGTRPTGIYTAGCAQNLVNNMGLLPTKKCVILGSGDIGLIMARRLTLEGAEVIGVYEAKNKPSGLERNIDQCLKDFDIPLYLSKTVTRVFGRDRLESVEIMDVDSNMNPIEGTEQIIECDSLILSVGLIPENELSEKLGIELCGYTKGPKVDNNLETNIEGVFSAGNSLSVNDLVDYVSINGFTAGKGASNYINNYKQRNLINVKKSNGLMSVVPQMIDLSSDLKEVTFYLRSDDDYQDKTLVIKENGVNIFNKPFKVVKQASSLKATVNLTNIKNDIEVSLE